MLLSTLVTTPELTGAWIFGSVNNVSFATCLITGSLRLLRCFSFGSSNPVAITVTITSSVKFSLITEELGFWLGYIMPSEVLEMVFMMGGVIIPLPFMVLRHRALEKEYKLN